MDYKDFIKGKKIAATFSGREVSDSDIHPMLFPFQRDVVRWAVHKGRAAIFLDTGLGKTYAQIEWARLMDVQTMAALGVGAMALLVPRGWMTMGMLLEREDEVAARARAVVLLVLFPMVLVQVLASGYSPFLYFQF